MELVIVLIVLAVVVFGVVLLVRKRRDRDPHAVAHQAELREARTGLRVAQKTRNDAIKVAQKSLKSAERAYEKQVRQARLTLSQFTDPDGKRLGSYAGMKLHELAIHTANGRGSLVGATATVDTAGNLAVSKRPTLTRMAAGGMLLGPVGALGSLAFQKKKKHDTRELYLLVETSETVSVVQCSADDGLKTRAFAAKINTAAKQAEAIAAARPAQIRTAQEALAAAEADTAAVETARVEVERVEADAVLADQVAVAQARLLHLEASPAAGQLALPAAAQDLDATP